MARKTAADYMDEIRKLVKTKKVIIGTERTLKAIKSSSVSRVYAASNAKDSVMADIKKSAKTIGIEFIGLDIKNDELGIICKKPFSISVLGVLKQ